MITPSVLVVGPDCDRFNRFLEGFNHNPGPHEPVVAGILYQREGEIQAAIVVYFHASLGVVASFFSVLERPFMPLLRCVRKLEMWLRLLGIGRLAFVVSARDRRYRSIVERWGAVAVGVREGDVLYLRELHLVQGTRSAGVRARHAGSIDQGVAGNGSAAAETASP